MLQKSLNLYNNVKDSDVEVDGYIGPQTFGALQRLIDQIGEKNVAKVFALEQYVVYRDIALKDPEQEVFFWGWIRARVLEFL